MPTSLYGYSVDGSIDTDRVLRAWYKNDASIVGAVQAGNNTEEQKAEVAPIAYVLNVVPSKDGWIPMVDRPNVSGFVLCSHILDDNGKPSVVNVKDLKEFNLKYMREDQFYKQVENHKKLEVEVLAPRDVTGDGAPVLRSRVSGSPAAELPSPSTALVLPPVVTQSPFSGSNNEGIYGTNNLPPVVAAIRFGRGNSRK